MSASPGVSPQPGVTVVGGGEDVCSLYFVDGSGSWAETGSAFKAESRGGARLRLFSIDAAQGVTAQWS